MWRLGSLVRKEFEAMEKAGEDKVAVIAKEVSKVNRIGFPEV